jgi:hypothetical protein
MDGEYKSELSEAICDGFRVLANAVTTRRASARTDATGMRVESLTESVMGVTAGLMHIAAAITDLADAVRERDA